MRTLKEKGGGLFKNLLNLVSGRKTARRKAMGAVKLTNAEKEKKKNLEAKWFKTRKQKNELKRLSAKLGLTIDEEEIKALQRNVRRFSNQEARKNLENLLYQAEPVYTKAKEAALEERSQFQKFFNRFYKQQEVPKAQTKYTTPIEGIVQVTDDLRKPLFKKNLQISNNSIPNPPDTWEKKERIVNGKRVMLLREPLHMGLDRIFAYLYKRAFNKDTLIANKVTQEEYNELRNRILEVRGPAENEDQEDDETIYRIAREVFHANVYNKYDLLDFNREIHNEEVGPGPEKKIIVGPDGQSYISETYTKGLERLLPFFYRDYKQIQYQLEYDSYQCSTVNRNVNNEGNLNLQPLTTLKSNSCISLVKNTKTIYDFGNTNYFQSNWLVLEPKYYPVMSPFEMVVKDLSAKYFKQATFIQDALDDWGFEGMDSALFELFQAKYPEIAIKLSTYLVQASTDFAYQSKKLKFTENMIILDKKFLDKEIDLTLLYPFSEKSVFSKPLKTAIQEKKVYGMTPYMAYITKKKSMNVWEAGFDSSHTEVYTTLNAYEKITFDYLQYLRFMDVLGDSNFDFKKAHSTYQDYVGKGTPWTEDSLVKELLDLYKEDVGQHKKELLFFQSLVERQFSPFEPKTLLQDPDDIAQLLAKFYKPVSLPNVVVNTPAAMITPPSINTRRNRMRTAKVGFAPTRVGAFEQARQPNSVNKTRKNAIRRLQEINTALPKAQGIYNSALQRLGGLGESSEKRYKFLITKLKQKNKRGALTATEDQFLKNYVVLRNFPSMKEILLKNRKQQFDVLKKLGYFNLPGSPNSMGNTNSNTNSIPSLNTMP